MATICHHVSRSESSKLSGSHQESSVRCYQFEEALLFSSLWFIISVVHPVPLSSILAVTAMSACLLAGLLPLSSHSFPVAVALTRVCQSQRQLLPLSPKKDGPPPSLSVYSLTSVLLPHQSVALSLFLSVTLVLLLARSLFSRQTVSPLSAADRGSAELQGCIFCSSSFCLLSTMALSLHW